MTAFFLAIAAVAGLVICFLFCVIRPRQKAILEGRL